MSWLEISHRGRRLLKGAGTAVFAGMLGLGMTGCGFHPLYTTTESGADLRDTLKRVEIGLVGGRVGQRVRNELLFGTTGGADPLPPLYHIDIALRESVRNTLVTHAGAPTGQILQLDAEFRLIRIKDGETVFKGYSTAEAAYDLSGALGNNGSVYGDSRASLDAENRAARSLADTLKTRLAAFLSHSA